MTLTTHRPTVGLRRPAWLLVATAPAYLAYLALSVMSLAPRADTSAELTPVDLEELGALWVVVHALWVTPLVLAAVALTALAREVPGPLTRWVRALAAITCCFAAAYLGVNLLALGSDAATWGDDRLYPLSPVTSLFAGWFGVHVATLIVVLALRRAGIARRTATVVAVLFALYLILEVLTYLPILFGPATFAGFLGGVPPFLAGVLWAVLGGGVLKSRIPSGV
jgi:hypothetical protein